MMYGKKASGKMMSKAGKMMMEKPMAKPMAKAAMAKKMMPKKTAKKK